MEKPIVGLLAGLERSIGMVDLLAAVQMKNFQKAFPKLDLLAELQCGDGLLAANGFGFTH